VGDLLPGLLPVLDPRVVAEPDEQAAVGEDQRRIDRVVLERGRREEVDRRERPGTVVRAEDSAAVAGPLLGAEDRPIPPARHHDEQPWLTPVHVGDQSRVVERAGEDRRPLPPPAAVVGPVDPRVRFIIPGAA
jgi:hypothetical protein